MTNIQDLPLEILHQILKFLSDRPKINIVATFKKTRQRTTPLPLIPMQTLLLVSLISPLWHSIAYDRFADIYHVNKPDCRNRDVFKIWQGRISCLLLRIERWRDKKKLQGGCKCHGQDALWIAGWDQIVRAIGKDDPGLRIWREWLQNVDSVKRGRLGPREKELERILS